MKQANSKIIMIKIDVKMTQLFATLELMAPFRESLEDETAEIVK